MTTRRNFLKQALLLAGASGVTGVVPEAVQRAFAITPEPGTTFLDAEHVVILMQENRSFDHVFGSLQGVRGFNDPRAPRQADGTSVFFQRDPSGERIAPWRLNIKDTRATWMGSIPHSRESQVDAWNGGQHDNWIVAKKSSNKDYSQIPLTMGHYNREDLPFYYALADAFTICDQHYCGAMTSTTPNRIIFWTGTVRNEQKADSIVYMRNPEIGRGGMTWTTYPERLQQAGISWKFYQNELSAAGDLSGEERAWLSNFGCNVLEFFAKYNVQFSERYRAGVEEKMAALHKQIATLRQKISSSGMAQQKEKTQIALDAALREMKHLQDDLEKSKGAFSDLSKEEQELFARAFVTNTGDPDFRSLETIDIHDGNPEEMNAPKGDIFYQFRKDVREKKLPTISWLASPEKFSDHPTSPWYGAWYVSEVMNILTENPEVWKKTIFILTYDENDGYFDHAPSFVAADPLRKETGRASAGIDTALEYTYQKDELFHGVSQKEARSGPIGLGFRVPMIIASPWSRGGWVNSEVCDHSSTLQFLEQFILGKFQKKVTEPNISQWRRTVAGDLTSNFRPYDDEAAKLPFLNRNAHLQMIQSARAKQVPVGYRLLSKEEVAKLDTSSETRRALFFQEPGTRPASALPYELYAEGELTADRRLFNLRMKAGNDIFGARSAGSPFNVYLRGTKKTSAVVPGTSPEMQMMVATYVVKPGDEIVESIDLSQFEKNEYHITVHGPNGFYREFAGKTKGPSLQTRCTYHRDRTGSLTGNLSLHLKNLDPASLDVVIRDQAYGAKPITMRLKPAGSNGAEATSLIDLGKSASWYDLHIAVRGETATSAIYAGHVDTGKPGSTDPAMGGPNGS